MENNIINLNNSQNLSGNNALAPESGGVSPVSGYHYDGNGQLFLDKKLVSKSYIEVTALARTGDNEDWGRVVSFKNEDGGLDTIVISNEKLLDGKESLKSLVKRGLSPSFDTVLLTKYLRSVSPAKRIKLVKKTGWIGIGEYLCVSFTIEKESEGKELHRFDTSTKDYGFAKRGILEDWKKYVCEPCIGNNVLIFCSSMSVSGTLMINFPQINTTTINLRGDSSIGKSTALHVAASSWGNSEDFIQPWRSTSNALEAIAEAHNDAFLPLDEMAQVKAREAGDIVYMLGNEQGKNRMTSEANLRKARGWRTMVLSSGEIGLADKISETGEDPKAGHTVRCVDIEADSGKGFGIFDTIPTGFSGGEAFANYFIDVTRKYHGVAAEAFVKRLIVGQVVRDLSNEEPCEFLDALCGSLENDAPLQHTLYENIKQKFYERFRLEASSGSIKRVAGVFIFIAVSGVMACILDVFVFPVKQIQESVYEMFSRWLSCYGGKDETSSSKIVNTISDRLMRFKDRFKKVLIFNGGLKTSSEGNINIANCLGYIYELEGELTFYVINEAFRKDICQGISVQTAKDSLIECGMLEVDGNRKTIRANIDGRQYRLIKVNFPNK